MNVLVSPEVRSAVSDTVLIMVSTDAGSSVAVKPLGLPETSWTANQLAPERTPSSTLPDATPALVETNVPEEPNALTLTRSGQVSLGF